MPMSQSAKSRMEAEVRKAVAEGNSFLANEITANVMVGTTMMIVFTVMLLCLLLNELGVFSADKHVMRLAVLIAAFIEVPITILNTKYVGTKPWLKVPLMVDLILVCGVLSTALTHNVTLTMVFPVVVSTRYFDEKYTTNVAVFTVLTYAVCAVIGTFVGIVNLNVAELPAGTVLSLPRI